MRAKSGKTALTIAVDPLWESGNRRSLWIAGRTRLLCDNVPYHTLPPDNPMSGHTAPATGNLGRAFHNNQITN